MTCREAFTLAGVLAGLCALYGVNVLIALAMGAPDLEAASYGATLLLVMEFVLLFPLALLGRR